ncbi:MAG: sensor histidine kinase [Bacteroidota bacterium]
MKKISIALLLLTYSFLATAQEDITAGIRELKDKISKNEGTEKLKLLDSLSRYIGFNSTDNTYDSITRETIALAYKLNDMDIALARTSSLIFYYANRANKPKAGIKVLEDFEQRNIQTNDYDILARLYTNAGDAYFFSGATKASIPVYEKAENFALQDNDSLLYATARTYKASAHVDMGNYATGSKLLKETTAIFTKQKDTINISFARNTLAVIYSKMGFYKEAKEERDQVISLSRLNNDFRSFIPNLYNASIDADKQGDQELRINHLEEAYKEIEKLAEPFNYTPIITYGLLSAYAQNGRTIETQIFFDKIQKKYAIKNPIPFESAYRFALADYFISIEDFKKAQIESDKALQLHLKANNTEGINQSYERLAEIHKALGNYESAFSYVSKYNHFNDSVNSIQKARALSYYQTLYETEKRDFKIASQKTEIAVLDEKNKVKQQWLIFGGLGLVVLFVIIYLIRSGRFAKKQQVLQEQFSQDLINGQEEERSRLARELHDSVGQKLMLLSKQTKKIDNPNMENLASSTLEEVRSISRGLHPANLERLGLTTAINALVYDINANTELFFTEEIDDIDNMLSKESELHLYRIIQETLSNIVKHSEAKAVKMEIHKTANSIFVLVSDNGKGFDFESKYKNMSLGLKTLYERAKILGAQLQLDSKINDGTEMRLNISI